MFPYVKESPASMPPPQTLRAHSSQSTSLRSQKPAWHRAPKPAVENRERLLVFVAGGMTYSEIREAYQLSNALNRDIFIGAFLFLCSALYNVLRRVAPQTSTGTFPRTS